MSLARGKQARCLCRRTLPAAWPAHRESHREASSSTDGALAMRDSSTAYRPYHIHRPLPLACRFESSECSSHYASRVCVRSERIVNVCFTFWCRNGNLTLDIAQTCQVNSDAPCRQDIMHNLAPLNSHNYVRLMQRLGQLVSHNASFIQAIKVKMMQL